MGDDTTEATGSEMTKQEIDAFLSEHGHGTLALANGDDAYGVPVSFGYDGDRLFFYLLQFGDESEKGAFLERTERACLVAYEAESHHEWRSIVVRGTLHDVSKDELEYVEEVMDDSAWFPTIYPVSEPVTDVRRLELDIDESTGRKGQGHQ